MKNVPFLLIIFLLSLIANESLAQKEQYNWLFGEMAWMSFNTADKGPKKLYGSQMVALEGCSSISDSGGNLLFYTNGIDVWNRNHDIMEHGRSIGGHSSSTQSSLIVKQPGNNKLYYIFTTESFEITKTTGAARAAYSIVDMSLDGGNGDVVTKDVLLFNHSSEKLAAVRHDNKKDVWIVGHQLGNNEFKVILMDEIGLSPIKNINIGWDFKYLNPDEGFLQGYMRFSHDGEKLAYARRKDSLIEIFDFNRNTGDISNQLMIDQVCEMGLYGLEFSPNNQKLYVATFPFMSQHEKSGRIYQFDLSSWNRQKIKQSASVIYNNNKEQIGAMQLAPDGKIYIAIVRKSQLAVIRFPNESAYECGFRENGFDLGFGESMSYWGFPNFIREGIEIELHAFAEDVCMGDTIFLESVFTSYSHQVVFSWTGPQGFISDESHPVIINATPDMSGFYKVEAIRNGKIYEDSVYVSVDFMEAEITGPEYICPGSSVELGVKALDSIINYSWSTGETSKNILVSSPGLYYAEIETVNGCRIADTIEIEEYETLKPEISGDDSFCKGDSAVLSCPNDYVDYTWSTGEKTKEIHVLSEGYYSLSVVDTNGCIISDTVWIAEYEEPKPSIISDSMICEGRSLVLSADKDYESYLWSNGSTEKETSVYEAGEYELIVTNSSGCAGKAEKTIHEYNIDIRLSDENIDFGFCYIQQSQIRQLIITNNGDDPIKIEAGTGNEEVFLIKSSLPMVIEPDESGELEIEFLPGDIIDYTDILQLHIKEPCAIDLSAKLSGSGKVQMLVKTFDLVGIIGENACVELHASLLTERNISSISNYDAKISLRVGAINVIGQGDISAGKKFYTLSGNNIEIGNSEKLLDNLCGMILLDAQNESDIEIISFDWDDPHVEVVTENGILRIDGLCKQDLCRLDRFEPASMTISPNPSDEFAKININSGIKGTYYLKIYSSLGIEMESFSWNSSSYFEKDFGISLMNYSAGSYIVQLEANGILESVELLFVR